MNLIRTFEELKNYRLDRCEQFWYYVILVNPRDLSKAGEVLFENLNIFHLDSGEECHYFIPGFHNTGKGIFAELRSFFGQRGSLVSVPGFGKLQFDDECFVNFYKELEERNRVGWRYSGECELLLFNISTGNKIKLNDFAAYNLDDIVRNERNVSEFIRTTINVGKDAEDQTRAKQMLDENFYEMIMPKPDKHAYGMFDMGWQILSGKGFQDNAYIFISYSSKDFKIVSEIRNRLCAANIPCWMAPFDIPSGTNYAYVIEHAIKHAGKFVLMLSRSAVDSVWVGKELKRAIDRFQYSAPEKICAVWLDGAFSLNDTPFALPLEDVQISVDLRNNSNNYLLLADKEKRREIQIEEKTRKYRDEIEELLSPDKMLKSLMDAHSRMYAIHHTRAQIKEKDQPLLDLIERLGNEIDAMKLLQQCYQPEFIDHYKIAMGILREIAHRML